MWGFCSAGLFEELLSWAWSDCAPCLLFPLQNWPAFRWHGAHCPRQSQAALFHRQRWADVQIYLEFLKDIKTPHSWWFQGETSRDLGVLHVPWLSKYLVCSQNRALDREGGLAGYGVWYQVHGKSKNGVAEVVSSFSRVASILNFPLLATVIIKQTYQIWLREIKCCTILMETEAMLQSATDCSWASLIICPLIHFYASLVIAAAPVSTPTLKFRKWCVNHNIDKINCTHGNIWALNHRLFSPSDSWIHTASLILEL